MMIKILKILVPILVVLALTLTGIRLLLTPIFLQIEYRMPGFPEDRYGFTRDDRLYWAPFALDYLTNSENISYLSQLTFEDGTKIFNDRELRHMEDVKHLTQIVLRVYVITLGMLAFIGVWAWRSGKMAAYKLMLGNGGRAAVVIVFILIVAIMLAFNAVFTGFHLIFFEGDSWMFAYSDTLIRLFPLRFWQDVFIIEGALVLVGGLALWFGFGRKRGRIPSD
jgi:integral membrane protein (TIGR01906 family)